MHINRQGTEQKTSSEVPDTSENARREKFAAHLHGTHQASRSLVTHLAPLLVSVRSLAEARVVAPYPFEILDFKEPNNGPLGACSPDVWQTSLDWLTSTSHSQSHADSSAYPPKIFGRRCSVALGERETAIHLAKEVPPSVDYAKAGVSGLPDTSSLLRMWEKLRLDLPSGTELVAVAYADEGAAGSLPVEKILTAAITAGLKTLLIDTFAKEGGGTLRLLQRDRLCAVIAFAKDAGCETVLAGGIDICDATDAFSMGARRIGVRGALCQGPRNGEIAPLEVARWTNQLQRISDSIELE